MSSSWQDQAAKKRAALTDLIPRQWILPREILESLPKNSIEISSRSSILSGRDAEITEIDRIDVLADDIAPGKYSALEVTEAYCKRAAIGHQLVNCLAEIFFDRALERARQLDQFFKENEGRTLGPLHGVPISLKDQFNVQGLETAMGYIGYLGPTAPGNSTLVDELLSLGAVLYVKTSLPQTVMLGESRSHLLGLTVSPWNRELSCGGSSGGEGSLLAMKGSLAGWGSDIGGSIRFPSALNGIFGLKPSPGRFPYREVKNSFEGQESVLSVIGPMARSLWSILHLVKSILQTEPWSVDPQVLPLPWREQLFQETQTRKLAFGVIRFDHQAHLSPPVQRAMDMAVAALQRAGHQLIEWDTDDHPQGVEKLVKFFQVDGGRDIRVALDLSGEPLVSGAFVGSPETEISVYDYWRLNAARTAFATAYLDRWNQTKSQTNTGRPIDGILSPIHCLPSYPHESPLSIGYTGIANLLGLSAVIIPVTRVDLRVDRSNDVYQTTPSASDFDRRAKELYRNSEMFDGCPVGLQIICRRLEEEKAIGLAMVLENALHLLGGKN